MKAIPTIQLFSVCTYDNIKFLQSLLQSIIRFKYCVYTVHYVHTKPKSMVAMCNMVIAVHHWDACAPLSLVQANPPGVGLVTGRRTGWVQLTSDHQVPI